MKKMLFGLIAIVVAASAVAFTTKDLPNYFWAYDATGTAIIIPNTVPPTSNPVSCPSPSNVNCAEERTAYNKVLVSTNPDVYEYRPAGTLVNLFLKP
jgi:hypothetical protein